MHRLLQMLRAQVDGRNDVCLCIATQAGLEHMSQLAVPVGYVVFALGAAGLVLLCCMFVCMLLLVCKGCYGVAQHEQPMVDLGSLLLPAHSKQDALKDLDLLPSITKAHAKVLKNLKV